MRVVATRRENVAALPADQYSRVYVLSMSSRKPEKWLVETTSGDRVYTAVSSSDARTQHADMYPDEYVTNIRPE